MHYFPDAFTYFGILFLLIFCFNVNMRLAFSFGFQTCFMLNLLRLAQSILKRKFPSVDTPLQK